MNSVTCMRTQYTSSIMLPRLCPLYLNIIAVVNKHRIQQSPRHKAATPAASLLLRRLPARQVLPPEPCFMHRAQRLVHPLY